MGVEKLDLLMLCRRRNTHKRASITAKSTVPCALAPYKMISDNDLYKLAIFLGSAAMVMIVIYHFLEVNAVQEPEAKALAVGADLRDKKEADIAL